MLERRTRRSAIAALTRTAATILLSNCCDSAYAGTTQVLLPRASTTSAAVYDAEGRLIRTLWSGRRQPAGALTIDWDGTDDDGAAADPAQRYTARVLTHDVRYVWDGVIGNTSRAATGADIHRAYGPINDMAIDAAGNTFYVVGYNEQQHALNRFNLADVQRKTALAHDDYLRVYRFVATDGTLAYFANEGGPVEPESFVVALRVDDGGEHEFAAGKTVMPGQNWGNRWGSVIDHESKRGNPPTGLAVQRNGSLLFVAHRAASVVRLYDKRSGEPQGVIEVAAPGDLDVAPDDSLWVVCDVDGKRAVSHYRLRERVWSEAVTVSQGLIDPVAIGVSPRDGTLVVADAGSEQLKAFDARGQPSWTHGRAGGYRDGSPDVTADALWLSDGPTYVAFAADGSFWIGDAGNVRNLHFSADREPIEQIMYLPASYVATVDVGDPTRVFRRFLEFSVDYSRPIRESWALVRNWGAGLDARYLGGYDGLHTVYTLRNGRTYGVVRRAADEVSEVVELTSSGLRRTQQRLALGEKLYSDGSIRSHALDFGALKIVIRPLRGFDGAGNPEWDRPRVVASVAKLQPRDPYYHEVPLVVAVNGATYPDTADGLLISFNPGVSDGFHLGGIVPGRARWAWRASASGRWEIDERGRITSLDGRYGLGNGVHYLGNVVMTSGRHVVYGYHGEGWNGGQANQWMHFLSNGLFVGQFGTPVYPADNKGDSKEGAAGNAFSPQLVSVGGELYLWHNDESVHGGLHRWHITGLDSIGILEASIQP